MEVASEYFAGAPCTANAATINICEMSRAAATNSSCELLRPEQQQEYLYPSPKFPPNPDYPKVGDFEVLRKDDLQGLGVISYRAFKQGDMIAAMTGDVVSDIRQHTLQIRPGLHNHDLWFSGYFLHSCNPNIRLDMEAMKVFAVRDIAANDWLYMDYSDTEDELFCCFPCQCGAATCRGFITGRQQQGRPNDDAACPHMDGTDATGSSGNVSPMLVDSIASGEMQSVTKEASVPAVQATGRWWARADLCYQGANLTFAGQDVGSLARQHGTPSFFYNGQRIVDNVQRLKGALAEAGFAQRSRVLYAMKANRFAPLLTFLRTTKVLGGIDCCSPNEVEHAIACGFRAEDISFTNTSLSRRDLERLSAIDGLMMNCDSLHSIRRWGELGRGREIGIRINPALGTGRADNNKLQYCGVTISKFGIYKEQLAEAIALAAEYDLTITRVHFHTGCG